MSLLVTFNQFFLTPAALPFPAPSDRLLDPSSAEKPPGRRSRRARGGEVFPPPQVTEHHELKREISVIHRLSRENWLPHSSKKLPLTIAGPKALFRCRPFWLGPPDTDIRQLTFVRSRRRKFA